MRQKLTNLLKFLKADKEVAIAVVVAVILSAGTLAVFTNGNPKHPDTTKESVTVTSTVTPESNETTATKGQELNWQKSVHATEDNSNIDGTILEEIDINQVFDGNLKLPKGWTVQYSCDPHGTAAPNRTYVATATTSPCTLATVAYLKINTGTAQTLKPFSQAPLVQPLDEKALSNSPFKTLPPVLFNNKVFQIMQAVNVQDGGSGNDFTINCFDLTTYATCTTTNNVTFPTYLSTTVGQLGSGPKNINTALNMQSYVDTDGTYGSRGYLYMPGQTFNSYGVVCVDLLTLSNCGFTSLGTSGAANTTPGLGNPVLLSGFVESGGKLYGHANDADKTTQTVVCYDLATDAICSGYTADTVAYPQTYKVAEHGNAYVTTGNHVLAGTKLFWTVNYSAGNSTATQANFCHGTVFVDFVCDDPATQQRSFGTVITCFDLTTKTLCSGWPNNWGGKQLFGTGGGIYVSNERPNTLYAWKNTDGSTKAVCLIVGLSSGVDPTTQCFDIANGNIYSDVNGTPGHPGKMLPSQWLTFPWLSSPNVTNVTDSEGAKTYIPFYSTNDLALGATPRKGATFCWNWTTASSCANFSAPKYWHEINGGMGGDSGYFYDGSCMWGVGYGDKIWSFNAQTGEAPCRVARTKYKASLTPTDFYCDGGSHVFNWGKIRLAKASMYDFDNFNVTVKNASGSTVLSQENLKTNSEINLTSIPYVGNEQLSIEVVSTVFNTSPWANSNLPFVNVVSSADDAQYCYKTKATSNCDVANISTISNASVVTDNDTIITQQGTTIPLNQPANEQCYKDLKASLTSDKSQINSGDNITYTLNVKNQANSNNLNLGIINGARYEITFPSNFTYVSSTAGGVVSGNKVSWANETINPTESKNRTVTLKAPATVAFLEKIKPGHVYAATSQTPVAVQAVVIAGDDINQADNNTSDNSVILTTTTPDPVTPTTPTTPEPDPTPTTPEPIPVEPGNNGFTEQPGAVTENGTTRRVTVDESGNAIPLTPTAIKNIIPPSLTAPTEAFFKALNSAVSPVPDKVAEAIPYGAIGFLVSFAIIYAYQAIQEARVRKNMKELTDRFKRTEAMRKNYIDLTSHYLNTPITTMQSTVELLRGLQQLPQATAEAAQQRLKRLVEHAQLLLGQSQALTDDSSKALETLNSVKTRPFVFSAGFVIPIIGVLITALLANLIFVWAKKYDASYVKVGLQSSFYVLGAVALASAYNSFRRQKYATAIAEQELKLEEEVATSQTNFITNAGNSLQNDVMELDQLAPSITTAPRGQTFGKGLSALKDAIAKMAYLNALTTHRAIPAIANDTIKELANEVIEKAKPFATENQVKMNVSIEPGLTAVVDLDGFTQLLSSTLDNAIKFNKPGGTVDLSITRKNDRVVQILVKDSGHGISKEKIDQLFTPFARGTDTLEFNYEGFGLDLYMDKLIAEQCGGTIEMDSVEGQGTTVTITLPS